MSASAWPPGWHGKLPSLGDFASRRLDAAVVEGWDGWLAAGLQALRDADAVGWLPRYLASPSWRFVLMPGAWPGARAGGPGDEAAAQAWAGVLMPSVDRVGRYFPFTLLWRLGLPPSSPDALMMLWGALARLDELAAEALQDDWSPERLEDELARMREPVCAGEPMPLALAAGAVVEAATSVDAADPAGVLAATGFAAGLGALRGTSWWHARPDAGPPRLVACRGTPAPTLVAQLLGAATPAR